MPKGPKIKDWGVLRIILGCFHIVCLNADALQQTFQKN